MRRKPGEIDSNPEKMNSANSFVRAARWEWLVLGGVLFAALLLRLYALERLPSVVIHDECDNLRNIYQILHGRGPGFFGLDWKPQPAASVYLQSLFVREDMSVFALRLPTALFSVAALIPFFLLLRREVSAVPALVTTALLATDTWYLHFSRTGWENVWVCLPFLAAAGCAAKAVRSGSMQSFVWTGVWSAVGAYGYFSGRAILPTMLAVFAVAWMTRRASRRRLAVGALLTVLATLVLLTPQIKTARDDWERFINRPRQLFVFGPRNAEKPMTKKVWLVGRNIARKTYELFASPIHAGTYEARYLPIERGALPRATALLAVLGLAVALRSSRAAWWWILLLVPFFLIEAMVRHKHLNGARALIMLPVLYLFVGLAIQHAWRWTVDRWPRKASPLVISLTAVVALSSTRHYFEWAKSAALRTALEPAIPLESFAAWQEEQLRRMHEMNIPGQRAGHGPSEMGAWPDAPAGQPPSITP